MGITEVELVTASKDAGNLVVSEMTVSCCYFVYRFRGTLPKDRTKMDQVYSSSLFNFREILLFYLVSD